MSQFSQSNPRLQLALDNSSISMYKDCPRKYYYGIVEGWRPKHESAVLAFGTLFHAGVEELARARVHGADHEAALRSALRAVLPKAATLGFSDPARNPFTLLRAITWYADHYRNDPLETVRLADGRPALELSFRFELPLETASGETFIYCGHIDRIATLNGAPYCIDYKTTTAALSDNYFARYSPNAQISGYMYAAKVLFTQPTQGFIIDAVQLGVSYSRPQRFVAPRSAEQLDEWLENTIEWIKRMEQSADSGSWPMNEESCTKYGSCQFREICNKTPGVRDNFLHTGFRRDRWNPLESR
jgi:CRISPR/Cas system-associated exonuclease Cas4 (RecB family)